MTDQLARSTSKALVCAMWLGGIACRDAPTVQTFRGDTMGTSYEVVIESRGQADWSAVRGMIERELNRVERIMSTYDPRSEVSRFSAAAGVEPMAVDVYLLDVVRLALDVARTSSGAFDPTVAHLVEAWGFGPGPAAGPPPDSATVSALQREVGFGRLTLDSVAGTLSKDDPGVGIDLSGIAKGFAAERIAGRIAELGYASALVDVGGELRVLGTHLDTRPWRVAVEGPGVEAPAVLGTIDLVDEGIATSGDFRDFYEDRGELYTHIIDPRTGFPLRFRGFSVSVVQSDATLADAWATALAVLGPEDGYELAEREGLAALFAWREEGRLVTRTTTEMEGRFTPTG